MYLNEFAVDFPEIYMLIDKDVNNALMSNQIHGEVTLREWDDLVNGIAQKYEQQDFFKMGNLAAQQFNDRFGDRDGFRDGHRDGFRDGFRDRDERRDNRRRRFNDFDVRDVIRLTFFRRLFR